MGQVIYLHTRQPIPAAPQPTNLAAAMFVGAWIMAMAWLFAWADVGR